MCNLRVRPASADDVGLILSLVHELAVFERAPEAVKTTEADLLRDGFGASPRFHCLIGELDGEAAGFALYFYNYSTWEGRAGIHLEDLFVRESCRGRGVGKALILELVKVARAESCPRLEWNVLDWNQHAIDFYEGLGAVLLNDWTICRLDRAAMEELARPGGN